MDDDIKIPISVSILRRIAAELGYMYDHGGEYRDYALPEDLERELDEHLWHATN